MISFPNAKINLGLNIVEKRNDGFHNIETIFCPIDLTDSLEFIVLPNATNTKFSQSGMLIDGNPEDNLIMKAYRMIANDFKLPNLHIHLQKNIPFGAGLGGGSSDAAFMIMMLNDYFDLNLNENQMEKYAENLGSDCPFFIKNKPTFAYEKGTKFKPINLDLSDFNIVLIKPNIHVSTKEAYNNCQPHYPEIRLEELINQDVSNWKNNIKNDFELSIFKFYPEIKRIKEQLYEIGATYASMSGSGSSVFGLFKKDFILPQIAFDNAFVWKGNFKL